MISLRSGAAASAGAAAAATTSGAAAPSAAAAACPVARPSVPREPASCRRRAPPPAAAPPAAEDQGGEDNGRPHMPRLASRSVPYLKTEAASDAHCVAHRPFNPECDVCVLSYSRAPPAKAGGFDAKNQPNKFEDLIAMDFKVISEADWFSTSADKVCLVVLDIATGYRGHYPSSNRSAAFVAESLKAFAGDVRPRRVHCDNADEFEAACKSLGRPSPTRPSPYDHERNGTAERAVETLIEQNRSGLLQSGLSHKWWSYVAVHAAFVLNRIMVNNLGASPHKLRFDNDDVVVLVPFGALIRVRLQREHARALLAPFAPVLQDAVFLSYELDEGCVFRGKVVVALCEDLRANPRTPTTHRVGLDHVQVIKPFTFPFRQPGLLRTPDAQRGAAARAEVPPELVQRTIDGEPRQVNVNWWPSSSRRPSGIAPSLWQHASHKAKRDAVKQYLDAGLLTNEDLDQMTYAVLSAKNAFENAELQYVNTIAILKYAMGYSQDSTLTLGNSLSELDAKASQIALGSIDENSILPLLQTQIELAQCNLRNKKAGFLPSLSAYFQQSYNAYRTNFDFFQDKPWYSQTNWGLQMRIPVFSSGKGRSVVKQSEIQLLQDEYSYTMTKQGLKLQEVQLKNTIASALKKRALQKENSALAERIYRNAINKEKLGSGNNLLVTQKLNQTMIAQAQYTASLIEVYRSKLELDKLYNKLNESLVLFFPTM